jgi:histidinol-phosphate aminotransferase
MPVTADVDLGHHGDTEVGPDLVDLAVNVRAGTPPAWLAERVRASVDDLAAYPDLTAAREAVAAHHGRPVDEVLLTAGAAEAFVLVARALAPRHAAVVHPQFTEPEHALRLAGHEVDRVVLPWPFRLAPDAVPSRADLVVVGNPTNPTSVLHPAPTIAALARPDRTLVVDEAFMDAVPGETASLARRRDLPGVLVVRSLTKTWGLAGLRVGYVLGDPPTLVRLAAAQPHWPLSTPALAAAEACTDVRAAEELITWHDTLTADRAHLVARLDPLPVEVVPDPAGPFVLVRVRYGDEVRQGLRRRGFAVRRGDTFPGLGADWLRVAVRDRATTDAFTDALEGALAAVHEDRPADVLPEDPA